MNLKTLFKISGIISVIAGVLAALCLISIKLMLYGMLFAIIGFICSAINIFLNTKYEYTEGRFSSGYIGMIFSSLPVLYLLYIIFGNR